MCNLYNMTTNQKAIRDLAKVMVDTTGNLPSLPNIYPDYPAPIVREGAEGRELAMARWGMPTPPQYLKTKTGAPKKTDPGVTNIRNVGSPHWRRWLGTEHRCLVPLTTFSEPTAAGGPPSSWKWFGFADGRDLAFFAGVWTNWTSVRKMKEGEITTDLFAFLTTEPNAVVGAVHAKAMPAILTTAEECETWLGAPWEEARFLQRPLPDDRLVILEAPASAT